jgi:hypothetical protein
MRKPLVPHPVATLFPEMPEADFAALVEDIRKQGVKIPILVHGGQILDGRHRYKACKLLHRPCPAVEWNGRDAWLEVQSRNLMRRHLAKDQIYAIRKLAAERFPELAEPLVAARAEARQRKAQAKGAPLGKKALSASRDAHKKSAAVIGASLGISAATVERVDRLAREAPEMVPQVAAGQVSVKKALQAVAVRRHSESSVPSRTSVDVDSLVRRVQQQLRGHWENCPLRQRAALLYGLQQVLRQFIDDQESMMGARPAGRADDMSRIPANMKSFTGTTGTGLQR